MKLLNKNIIRFFTTVIFIIMAIIFMPQSIKADTIPTVSTTSSTATYINTHSYTFQYTIGNINTTGENTSNTAKITSITLAKVADMTIPTTVKVKYNNKTYTLKVTEIGNGSKLFTNDNTGKRITIPNTNITKVNANAMNGVVCKEINLQNEGVITEIGDYAFYNQNIIQTTVTQSKLKKVGKYAFYNALKNLSETINLYNVEFVGESAFRNNSKLVNAKLRNDDQTTRLELGSYAFADCPKLQRLVYNDAYTTITNPSTIMQNTYAASSDGGNSRLYMYDGFDKEYSSSFIKVNHKLADTYLNGTNNKKGTIKDQNKKQWIDVLNGAVINGKNCDMRIYGWGG